MLNVIYAQCHIQALYAQCLYDEYRYAECRGAMKANLQLPLEPILPRL